MKRVRTYLNPIRASQIKQVSEACGFESVSAYLDDHIAKAWLELNGKEAPLLPGFEIYSGIEDNEHIVFFATRGTTAIHITAREAGQFSAGIGMVLDDIQRTYFIASTVDAGVILFFGKQGTGYQFIIHWNDGNKKIAVSTSIARDLAKIFKHYSTTSPKD